eukprot:TRINITY_DN8252_c0_g1_i2.p1 TRINITY_DN8252_c0_g1~~TRINITY_DN8252_c0_g1_i2.p1  ORF type:complete len:216 (-),score=-4.77 TRINITY_DN8252_c0_g1_i2:89-736(-)
MTTLFVSPFSFFGSRISDDSILLICHRIKAKFRHSTKISPTLKKVFLQFWKLLINSNQNFFLFASNPAFFSKINFVEGLTILRGDPKSQNFLVELCSTYLFRISKIKYKLKDLSKLIYRSCMFQRLFGINSINIQIVMCFGFNCVGAQGRRWCRYIVQNFHTLQYFCCLLSSPVDQEKFFSSLSKIEQLPCQIMKYLCKKCPITREFWKLKQQQQ